METDFRCQKCLAGSDMPDCPLSEEEYKECKNRRQTLYALCGYYQGWCMAKEPCPAENHIIPPKRCTQFLKLHPDYHIPFQRECLYEKKRKAC